MPWLRDPPFTATPTKLFSLFLPLPTRGEVADGRISFYCAPPSHPPTRARQDALFTQASTF